MAAFHLGTSTFWSDMAVQAGEQAAMWLGDIGPVVITVIGAGLMMMIIGAIVHAIKS